MATSIHPSLSCLLPFYTIPIFPLLNRKIFHLLVCYYQVYNISPGSIDLRSCGMVERTSARFSVDGRFRRTNDGLSTACDTSERRQQAIELLSERVFMVGSFAKLPYTSLWTYAFHSVCVPRSLSFGFLRIRRYMAVYAPRVMHFSALHNFSWVQLIQELETNALIFLNIMRSATYTRKPRANRDAIIGMCTAILRFSHMCLIQKLLSLILYAGHCGKQVHFDSKVHGWQEVLADSLAGQVG